ncbi:MAG: hypothetical protein NTX93_06850 [Bacteroidia bacterium]|nr:hypothetical protein [Bacteroidia bacterium]
MMKFIYPPLFLLLSIHCSGQVFDQQKKYPNGDTNKKNDLQFVTLQTDYITKLYYQVIATPKDIINGKECLPYSFRSKTTPMFYSREKLNATLNVNNRLYKNIKLQYDTFKDDLIYIDTNRIINFEFPRIALNKDIIEGFSLYINGDIINFKHLRFPESSDKKLVDGFYEVVYEGSSTRFIIKHRSTLYNKEGLNEYKYSPERYVSIGEKYYKIRNKKNFILMFGNHSQEIKEFLRKAEIRIKKAGKDQIIEVLKYYDSLKESGRLTR